MSRLRSRLLVPALALIALGFLGPALAMALPQGEAVLSAAERPEAAPGRLSQLWSLLSRPLVRERLDPQAKRRPCRPDLRVRHCAQCEHRRHWRRS